MKKLLLLTLALGAAHIQADNPDLDYVWLSDDPSGEMDDWTVIEKGDVSFSKEQQQALWDYIYFAGYQNLPGDADLDDVTDQIYKEIIENPGTFSVNKIYTQHRLSLDKNKIKEILDLN